MHQAALWIYKGSGWAAAYAANPSRNMVCRVGSIIACLKGALVYYHQSILYSKAATTLGRILSESS